MGLDGVHVYVSSGFGKEMGSYAPTKQFNTESARTGKLGTILYLKIKMTIILVLLYGL